MVKAYGIYIGYDYVSVVSRNFDSPVVTPLFIYPLRPGKDRYREVALAFDKVISGRHVSAGKSSVAQVCFESHDDVIFLTDCEEGDIPDMTEMMSWELLLRVGADSLKEYNVSSFKVDENRHFVAASKIKDVEFCINQISRLGLRTITVEPSIVAAVNLFESNYDVSSQALVANIGYRKASIAYMKGGMLTDIAQYTARASELIPSEDVMKLRAEISARNSIDKSVLMYVTGDLLADKEYSELLISDIANCATIDPFKCLSIHEKTNKELMDKYSTVFGIAVSLSSKTV